MPRIKEEEKKVDPAPHRVIRRAPESLRAASRVIREQVAADREQIAAEAEDVIREAGVAGKLQAVRVLFQQSEQEVLDAIDAYASRHGLSSRAQVMRVALSKLLKIEVATPKWGWAKGRARKSRESA